MRSSKLLGAACAAASLLAVPGTALAADEPPDGTQQTTGSTPCMPTATLTCPPTGGGPGGPGGPPGGQQPDAGNENERVTLCHKPGPRQHTITVSENAVDAHKGHGDYLGPCRPWTPSPGPGPHPGPHPGPGHPPHHDHYILVCRNGHTIKIRRSDLRPGDVIGMCVRPQPGPHPQPQPYPHHHGKLIVVCFKGRNALVFLRDWLFWKEKGATWGWCRGQQGPIESVPCTPPGAEEPAIQPCPPAPCPPEAHQQTQQGPASYESEYGRHGQRPVRGHRHHRHGRHWHAKHRGKTCREHHRQQHHRSHRH